MVIRPESIAQLAEEDIVVAVVVSYVTIDRVSWNFSHSSRSGNQIRLVANLWPSIKFCANELRLD